VNGDFIIQSHRGAGHLAPENTLEAFERAWELGTCPEADLRTTRDGIIVSFHDRDLQRILPGAPEGCRPRVVHDLTWTELAAAAEVTEANAQWLRVPRLEEIFARMQGCPGRRMYLDIKAVDLAELAARVQSGGLERQVILASPQHELIRQWKQLSPAGDTLLWIGGDEARIAARLQELRGAGFEGITQLQIHVRLRDAGVTGPDPFLPSGASISALGRELRERGILFQALPWDIALPEVYERLLDLGVASFATDYPEVACRVVRRYFRPDAD
jgi:glycerophosphoryl diester phosphodiesterase